MPKPSQETTILDREIFREGWSIDERAWHPTFIYQVVENTKLLMNEAGLKPLVLPDHPPEDEEKAAEWFSKIKAMGHAIDLMVKLDKEGKIVLGGKLKLTPSFSKEYEESDYPSVSIGIGPSKMLPSGKRVGPHIDHIAIFGHKHAAMSDLATESEAEFTSLNFSPRHTLSKWEDVALDTKSSKQEVYAMDAEKMEKCYALLMELAAMMKPEGGGEGEVVVEEEMESDEEKKKDELASTDEEKKEELAAEDDKKEEMGEKYTEAFAFALNLKAEALSIPKAKLESFTNTGKALHAQHKGDLKKTFKDLDSIFSEAKLRPAAGGVLNTPRENQNSKRIADDAMYARLGLDGAPKQYIDSLTSNPRKN